MRTYLSGAIENTADGGATWRQKITPKLEALGCDVFNPCAHIDGGLVAKELGWQTFNFNAWKNLRQIDPHEFYRVGRLIKHEDLVEVVRSDMIIVRMDKITCSSDGTCGEMSVASLFNVPVYVFCDDGVNHYDIPAWKMWCIDKFFKDEREFLHNLAISNLIGG